MSDQPELVCNRCQPVEDDNTRLRQGLRTISGEHEDTLAELAGARATLRTLERQLSYAKSENEQARETAKNDDPKAQSIKAIYETWVVDTGRNKNTKLTTERWDLIKAQLGNHNADDLIRAIKGAALLPYVRYGKRYVFGAKDELETQLEHCIGQKPAGRVEKNIDYYRRACRAAAEQTTGMWDTFWRIQAQADMWARLVMDPAVARDRGIDVDDLEQHLWNRLALHDQFWDDILVAAEPAPESDIARVLRETAPSMPASNVIPIRTEAA